MQFFKHALQQPFVLATGVAALVHSTWALGTLFSGKQPEGLTLALVGWLVPAFLIAFALDIGQIATSVEIRQHGLTMRRGVTFVVFAVATYYLQWLYICHHMPALALADGVRQSWEASATWLRDAAVWIIPALMPLSTLLYTFSAESHTDPAPEPPMPAPAAEPSTALALVEQPAPQPPAPPMPFEQPEEQPAPIIVDVPAVLVDDTEPVEVRPTPPRPRQRRARRESDV